MKAAALLMAACSAQLLLAPTPASAAFEPCDTQAVFNIRMCKSHMCTSCSLAWCMESCQKLQETHPGCRCEDWPATRVSYSGGDYKGKGKYGDVGDYAKD